MDETLDFDPYSLGFAYIRYLRRHVKLPGQSLHLQFPRSNVANSESCILRGQYPLFLVICQKMAIFEQVNDKDLDMKFLRS